MLSVVHQWYIPLLLASVKGIKQAKVVHRKSGTYFARNSIAYNAYIEVLSYDKILNDARLLIPIHTELPQNVLP